MGVSVSVEFPFIASAQLVDDFTKALSIEFQLAIRNAVLILFFLLVSNGYRQRKQFPTRHDWTCESSTTAVEPFSAEDDLHMRYPFLLYLQRRVRWKIYRASVIPLVAFLTFLALVVCLARGVEYLRLLILSAERGCGITGN